MENTTVHQIYTGNIGWSGGKRHIIGVEEDAEGDFRGRPRPACCDAFRWNGTMQATYIKKETPTTENISCKKCLIIVERIEAQKVAA